jgi:hypothetical protein
MTTTATTENPRVGHELVWTLDQDYHVGSFSWTSPGLPFTIWATPFWEDCEGIAVQISSDNGEELLCETLVFTVSDQERKLWDEGKWSELIDTQTMSSYVALMMVNMPRLFVAALAGAFGLLEKASKGQCAS